ncbi:type II toxin-antitoxin system PemK/MazF family toxin [Microbacterium sp. LRZ72]|uniref:type II toxin-antitoxin system PemK/MazF family toxin n=1 Tax=Microbacterium sp. LRZ72 TaxID=2942481 RepID=UPI0029AA4D1C|nr:type II toxin-antitoxin system PemK/MazF family toxin [Microbacterium sp. LRZ72]MDX2375357.1 type II toxin-antitoxin system PemK/MazF family toxin [Microbacterium sp. LRZ72]
MASGRGILRRIVGALSPRRGASSSIGAGTLDVATTTVAVPTPSDLRLSYAPDADGDPDAGEIVWTWVPYDENDGRGKDRPVLVIARASEGRVYALRLTSSPQLDDRGYVALGAGEWDRERRPSWVDLERFYSVHPAGMRREAAALDPERFTLVARALVARYGRGIVGA